MLGDISMKQRILSHCVHSWSISAHNLKQRCPDRQTPPVSVFASLLYHHHHSSNTVETRPWNEHSQDGRCTSSQIPVPNAHTSNLPRGCQDADWNCICTLTLLHCTELGFRAVRLKNLHWHFLRIGLGWSSC